MYVVVVNISQIKDWSFDRFFQNIFYQVSPESICEWRCHIGLPIAVPFFEENIRLKTSNSYVSQ